MDRERRKFERKPAEARKEALILATLDLVAENGVRGATVRGIAKQADVTQGLVRHYFSTKEELISAAYEYHMNALTDQTAASAKDGKARSRLARFISATLTPPVVDARSVALWAAFLNKVRHDAGMRAIHERTYVYFRDHLEELIKAALDEAGQSSKSEKLRYLAIAGNAVIDGLWLEGGALPDAFSSGELAQIGLRSVGAIIEIPLEAEAEQP
ncbi:TetR/AcrR family transcriptional regulator [Roseovarius nitratireducens]|uniref:TetR/AcrR family transcriptional regulator n=1 Tax=Roseovarius nitratireducens TaxID=2044597 RepID=UPI000CE1D8FB|nr:TetR family transcriptional regulator C-terminal domain-containing protein [Roseovarius nitratireducens]